MILSTRDTIPADIPVIFANLRDCDYEDGAGTVFTEKDITFAMKRGPITRTIIKDDSELIGIYGLTQPGSLLSRNGYAWLLATDQLKAVQISFLKQVRTEIQELLQHCPVIVTLVNKTNSTNIKWLEWCGFQIDREGPSTREGFYMAKLERK